MTAGLLLLVLQAAPQAATWTPAELQPTVWLDAAAGLETFPGPRGPLVRRARNQANGGWVEGVTIPGLEPATRPGLQVGAWRTHRPLLLIDTYPNGSQRYGGGYELHQVLPGDFTVALVFVHTRPGGTRALLGPTGLRVELDQTYGDLHVHGGPWAWGLPRGPHAILLTRRGLEWQLRVRGRPEAETWPAPGDPVYLAGLGIGATAGSWWDDGLLACLVVPRALTAGERRAWAQYVGQTWGLP